jgi:hypothetical protein
MIVGQLPRGRPAAGAPPLVTDDREILAVFRHIAPKKLVTPLETVYSYT